MIANQILLHKHNRDLKNGKRKRKNNPVYNPKCDHKQLKFSLRMIFTNANQFRSVVQISREWRLNMEKIAHGGYTLQRRQLKELLKLDLTGIIIITLNRRAIEWSLLNNLLMSSLVALGSILSIKFLIWRLI